MVRVDAVVFVCTCRRLIDLSLIAGSALVRWVEFVDEVVAGRQVLTKAVRRMGNMKTAAVLHMWREIVVEKERLHRILDTMVARFTNARITSAFDGWVHASKRQKRNITIISTSMRRLANACVGSAFEAWKEYAFDAACFVYTCRRLIDLSLIAGTQCR